MMLHSSTSDPEMKPQVTEDDPDNLADTDDYTQPSFVRCGCIVILLALVSFWAVIIILITLLYRHVS